jgi:hypothetical protein
VGGSAGRIDASQFFYATPGTNTCRGDSGGPAFFVKNGVEHLAGVTSFGDPLCLRDGVQARTDGPTIAAFIQPLIDAIEPDEACRADGACNAACNAGGQVQDPDCQAAHCGRDGVCAQGCVAPVDPDCSGAATGEGEFVGASTTATAIPDASTQGISSSISVPAGVTVGSVQVELNIEHPFRGDLEVTLRSPTGVVRTVVPRTNANDSGDNLIGQTSVPGFSGSGSGAWTLQVRDLAAQDVGRLVSWRLAINRGF